MKANRRAWHWLPALLLAVWLAGAVGAPLRAANQPPLIEDDDELLPGGPAGKKPEPKAPTFSKGMVIGCLGDDWTVPNPVEKMAMKSYPLALQMLLDAKYGPGFVRVVAAGQAGATVANYDAIYTAQLEKLKPDIVIVQDADQPMVATGFKLQLEKLATRIRANKTAADKFPRLLLLETFHSPEFVDGKGLTPKEFFEAHDWTANNQTMQAIAKEKKAQFIELRGLLGTGYGVLKELNYTRPFREDGLVPTYMGATLIAMKVLDTLGEDLNNYNFRAWGLSDPVRLAAIGLLHGQQFINGKALDDEPATATAVAPELALFDKALRVERRVVVAYFGGDALGKGAWIGQNAAWLKTYYGPKVETLNATRAGDTSKSGLARMEVDVLKYKPSLLVVGFGFSDARDKAEISLEDSRANLKAIIEKTRKFAPDCAIVLVTTHSLNSWGEGAERRSDLSAYYKVVREVAAEEKLGLIDNSPQWDDWAANAPDKYNAMIGTALIPGPAGQAELAKKAQAFFEQACPRAAQGK